MNILILGSSGKIGSFLKETLEKKHKIFAVNRSNINKKINQKLDIVINCLGSDIYKNSKQIKKIYNFYSKDIFRTNNFRWLEISTISIYGVIGKNMTKNFKKNIIPNKKLLTDYGISKLDAENLLIKIAKSRKFRVNIYRFGIVIDRNDLNKKLINIFNRFIYFRIFINFFEKNAKLKVSYLETIFKIINSDIFSLRDKNKITTYFEEIDIYSKIQKIFKIIFLIRIKLSFIYSLLRIFNINNLIKMELLFNSNLSESNYIKINKTYTF